MIERPESVEDTETQKRNSASLIAQINSKFKVNPNLSDIKHVIANRNSTEVS